MKKDLNISLTYRQVFDLVRQLPRQQKLMLTRELEKEAINSKLVSILQSFKTEDLSQDIIDTEVEAVRQEIYERSKEI